QASASLAKRSAAFASNSGVDSSSSVVAGVPPAKIQLSAINATPTILILLMLVLLIMFELCSPKFAIRNPQSAIIICVLMQFRYCFIPCVFFLSAQISAVSAAEPTDNPLLKESTLPYRYPVFDK